MRRKRALGKHVPQSGGSGYATLAPRPAPHFVGWLDMTPCDITAFWKDTHVLYQSLNSHNSPEAVLGKLKGGFQDFLTSELGVQICIGMSPLTTLPGTGFLPISLVCTSFGGTPLQIDGFLKPNASPITIFLSPEGLSKQTLSHVFDRFIGRFARQTYL